MTSSGTPDLEKHIINDKEAAQIEEIHHEEHVDDITPELEAMLHTNPAIGLTSQEVAERTLKFGKNELPERKKNPLLKLLSFFTGAIAYLIEIACIIAAIGRFSVFWSKAIKEAQLTACSSIPFLCRQLEIGLILALSWPYCLSTL